MKKIMFNDRYGLTQAVIEGRKTVTRRVMSQQPPGDLRCMSDEMNQDERTWTTRAHFTSGVEEKAQYYVGEIVAVAQTYEQIGANPQNYLSRPEIDGYQIISKHKGWRNKMYTRAELMPHQIRITGVRAERLQDITDEDCQREGVRYFNDKTRFPRCGYFIDAEPRNYWASVRKCFASLIDKVSGMGTWERNPWVWVYEFELVK